MRPADTRARTFSTPLLDRCTGCQVGQGSRCECRARAPRREIPTPVLQVLVYGSSIAFVCWVGWLLWRAFA